MDGAQQEILHKALTEAYEQPDLKMMLQFRLNKRLDLYVSQGNFSYQVFELMQKAEMEGWLRELVVKASLYRPGNAPLLKALQEFDLAPVPRTKVSEQSAPFERMIEDTNPLLNPLEWIEQAGHVIRRVCHITVPRNDGRKGFGTGFLVGPDVILTNYHVIEPVIQGQAIAGSVRVRFDYCAAPDGFEVYAGVECQLKTSGPSSSNWLVDHSPYDPADLSDAPVANPNPDNLDYALLRLATAAGNFPAGRLGTQPGEDAPPRGWITLPDTGFAWAENPHMPLLILQHPGGAPMKLAYRSDAEVAVNGNRTRVRYGVNTEKGASGSPCFTKDWEPVALHHAGDPDYAQMARYNQGIPLAAVAERIRRGGEGKDAISVPFR